MAGFDIGAAIAAVTGVINTGISAKSEKNKNKTLLALLAGERVISFEKGKNITKWIALGTAGVSIPLIIYLKLRK